MKAKDKYTVVILTLLSFAFTFDKCEKILPLPACSGDCYNVVFGGQVWNEANNLPIANTKIKITTPGDYGAVDTVYIVGNVNTDANGNFIFIKSIDTSIHKEYTFCATLPSGYLTAPQPSDQYSKYPANIETQYSSIYSNMQNIQFMAFPITKLAIKLHRSSLLLNSATYVNLNYSITKNGINLFGGSYTGFQESSKNIDTVVYLETSPVLYTNIQWETATYNNNNALLNSGVDSIACIANSTNQITITY